MPGCLQNASLRLSPCLTRESAAVVLAFRAAFSQTVPAISNALKETSAGRKVERKN